MGDVIVDLISQMLHYVTDQYFVPTNCCCSQPPTSQLELESVGQDEWQSPGLWRPGGAGIRNCQQVQREWLVGGQH